MSGSKRPTSEGAQEELRRAAESRVGPLSDEQWQDMIDLELIDPNAPYSDHEVSTIVELVENRFELWGSRPKPRMIRPGSLDKTRAAYEETLAWFAAKYVPLGVRRFRESVLRGRILKPEEARSWLNGALEAATLEHELPSRWAMLVSGPPDSLVSMWSTSILELRDPTDGLDYWAPVAPNTDPNWLRGVSEVLAADIGWTKAEAALWIVAGVTPATEMIKTVFHPAPRYNRFGERIEMTIDPAVSPRDVMTAYGEARSEIVARRTRMQTPKHLNLAKFADERPEGETWSDSMRRWNKSHPKWRYPRNSDYTTDVTQFARDATEAYRRFVEQRPLGKGAEGA